MLHQTLSEEQLSRIYRLRDRFIYLVKKRRYFPSQEEFSNNILKSVFCNEGQILTAMFTRQHGKTTIVTDTVGFLINFYFPLCKEYNIPTTPFFNIGIFAPQIQQSQTAFNMLKYFLIDCKDIGIDFEFTEFNGDTINIRDNLHPPRQVYCFTASPKSHPESKTLNLIIFDESQDLVDRQIDKAISPMGASTNATQVFIGVAGYQRCRFWELGEQLPQENKIVIPIEKAFEERDLMFEKTQNPVYLNYRKYIAQQIKLMGISEDSDHYKTQYQLQWILERGQFITYENLMKLEEEYQIYHEYTEPTYGGIDWGKIHDPTVFTVVDGQCAIIGWYEFLGDDYSSQIEQIGQIVNEKYHGMRIINCDATATQDMAVDTLRRGLMKYGKNIRVEGINFSTHKDQMYKNLSSLMHDIISGKDKDGNPIIVEKAKVKFPKNYPGVVKKERFITEFLNLQKEIKNEKWSCHHPEGPQYHDDFADSLALACYCFKKQMILPGKRFIIA